MTESSSPLSTPHTSSNQDTPAEPSDNPLLTISTLDFHYPPFDRIQEAHFSEALETGMAAQLEEVKAIAQQSDAPTFENTIVPLEKSGLVLRQVLAVFFNLTGAHTNAALQKLEAQYSPRIVAHFDTLSLDTALFDRINTLYQQRDELDLDAESLRLLEEYYKQRVRAGAQLDDEKKSQLKSINTRLASLATEFEQNVLAEVNDAAVLIDTANELEGLTEEQITAAAHAAAAKGYEGHYLLTLVNTTGQPIIKQLKNRDLRKRVYQASEIRGQRGNQWDNTAIIAETFTLRAQRADLLGYDTHADYELENQMAGSAQAVNTLLNQLVPPAVKNAQQEAAELQALIDREQDQKGEARFTLQAWDWDFYAEKLRLEKYALDEAEVKPYFELNNVLENGAFYAAQVLYGLTFKQRHDLPRYHPDTTLYDVFDEDGAPIALFLFDPFARPSKHGGAWMNSYVDQSTLLDNKPVVANHLNIIKPAEGKPVLLDWDEVTTLFHEFGHALHGMLSDVTYPYFSGTNVPTDFVEFPSQFNEMWAKWPDVLKHYAKHYQTGEPIPDALLEKMKSAERFNQGFAITEYLGATVIDQYWHQRHSGETPEASAVSRQEQEALVQAGIQYDPVPPRYHTPYFSHIMGGYGAGYYSYVWAEVLDADIEEWIANHGGLTRENGRLLRDGFLSRGGSEDPKVLFRRFYGKDQEIEPLLRKRGLSIA
ncbi:Dipeptidyl carboxypeptidase [Halomonadaceae bacterium LMG 33818]|uniref:M3 family metallopeptidase n=1 Tax=Cernens ardua TaxID=3402176 RepID=UPI003EDBA4AB